MTSAAERRRRRLRVRSEERMDARNTAERAAEPHRGRSADAPQAMPPKGWKDILWRTWREISNDRVTLIAAGATYFLLLSIFPTLTAFVSIYGLFADPRTVTEHVAIVSSVVPPGGIEIIREQLTRLTAQGGTTLGLALFASLAIALWSSSAGVKAMFEAMNVAYDEHERRGFFKLNLLALLFTLGGIVLAIAMVGVVIVLPMVLGFLGMSGGVEWLVQAVGYLLVVVMLFVGLAALYRFGPDRQQAKWRWLTPGAGLAVVAVLAASLLFSWYSANFANFDRTYGSLGALIGFLIWIWISVTVVLVGAELNSELEHQTAEDTTIGADQPMGMRNATMADTLGRSLREGGDPSQDSMAVARAEQAGYREGERDARKGQRLSVGSLVLAVPVALALLWLERKRNRPQAASRA
jgi:membrane protein